MNMPESENGTHLELDQSKNNPLQDLHNSQVFGKNHSESGNLDKIRDILFGNQVRDYEQRFTRLEEHLVKECSNLREDTKKRLDVIETYIKNEVDSLTTRLKNEQNERDAAVTEINEEFKNLVKSLERKIAQLEEQTSHNQRDLRQQILDQSKSLDNDLKHNHNELLATLERESKELHTHKTDRSTLARLFSELALRLDDEPGKY
jgi:DNA repair exonuclease SbcCD ATPase subunit